jgi:HEAT repeat protein
MERAKEEMERRLCAIAEATDLAVRVRLLEATDALVEADGDALQALLACAQEAHADAQVRATACCVLGRRRDKRSAWVLLSAFGDARREVFWEAAKALASIRNRHAFRPLAAALAGEKDMEKRKAAAYALGWLGDQRAVEPLLERVADAAEDPRVRGQAAESLGYLLEYLQMQAQPDAAAVDALIAALRDPSGEVRFWAAFALGLARDHRAIPELERLAEADHQVVPGWWAVSKEAHDAIANIKNEPQADA